MVKKVQMYAEKVAAHYDPHSNPVLGPSPPPPPPHSTFKCWEVCFVLIYRFAQY